MDVGEGNKVPMQRIALRFNGPTQWCKVVTMGPSAHIILSHDQTDTQD